MDDEALYRDLAVLGADMELRATGVDGGDGRTLVGIAVPWNRPTTISHGLVEEFVSGAFDRQMKDPGRVPLSRDHLPLGGKLIGKVSALRNDAKGLYVEARIAPTMLGEETLALLREGALDHWSIGFIDMQSTRTPGGVTQRKKARLTELAIVMEGAYGNDAKVLSMRGEMGRHTAARRILEQLPQLPLPPRCVTR